MTDCDLCARYCHVNRCAGIKGAVCRTGVRARVNSYGPHHGEEDPLRGVNGSGTLFYSWCSQCCVFCQNWEISQKGVGHEVEPKELAGLYSSGHFTGNPRSLPYFPQGPLDITAVAIWSEGIDPNSITLYKDS